MQSRASVVAEEARRIALVYDPIAAVVDAGSWCSAAAWAQTATCSSPRLRRAGRRLPAPPRVEVSALGESAVLDGALAIGRDEALDRVFEQRPIAL